MMIPKSRASTFFFFWNTHEGLHLTRTANCEKNDYAKKGIASKT